MKKILLAFLLLIFCFTILVVNVKAEEDEIDFSQSDTIKESEYIGTDTYDGDVKFIQYKTKAYNDGFSNNESKLNDYVISWLDYGTNDTARIVNWTLPSANEWSGSTVTHLGSDFEGRNPGYKVIGGVNGDFFHIQTNDEVMNLSMQEGNLLKPWIWSSRFGSGVLGWDKEGNLIDGIPTISTNMYLELLGDDGTVLTQKEIASVNAAKQENGINFVTRDKDATLSYDVDGYKVVEVAYTLHRYSQDGNSKGDRLYVRGLVTNISTDLKQIDKIDLGYVYLYAKGTDLDFLNIGSEVRIQYHLTGEWTNVYNTTGYYAKILENGKSLFYQSSINLTEAQSMVSDTSYINCLKNRTVVGKKADGSTVLMTIEYNKKGAYGASYYECAEYLRLIGCVEGWLLDGGGSTTIATRKTLGGFELRGGASDGSERLDGNGLLLVIKDPGIKGVIKEKTRFSVTLDIGETDSPFKQFVQNIKITVNGVTKDYNGTPLTFDGLDENTFYQARIDYELNEEKVESGVLYQNFYTDNFKYPSIYTSLSDASSDALVIKKEEIIPSNVDKVYNQKIIINEKEYSFDGDYCLITGLDANTYYNYELSFDCTEKDTGKVYSNKVKGDVIKTVAKDRPLITCFNVKEIDSEKVIFNIGYYDPAGLVNRCYVDCSGLSVDIENGKSTVEYAEVDFTEMDYEFYFYLVTDKEEIVSDKLITLKQTPKQNNNEEINNNEEKQTKKKKCGKKSLGLFASLISLLSAVVIIFRKKN